MFRNYRPQQEAPKLDIHIPTPLRPYTGNQETLKAEGATVGQALQYVTEKYPALQKHLFTDSGTLRAFVNVYKNDEDIRYLQQLETPLSPQDELSIIPSIAGGATVAEPAAPPTTSATPVLTKDEIGRYSRHLIMPEVGMEGQQKLKAARVLCIGAGGLGSPLALYLAAAGVGTLGMVDMDVVDASNLQRQVIHSTADLGRPKLDSAADKLQALNPYINIVKFQTMLSSENALEIFKDFDMVVDGTDNFPTRYLVNDACVLTGKPNVYGSIFRFEGQASVFATEQGPCYRCLYPEPPPPGLVPSCAEGGVLGILPGLVGIIQATEAIKLILGKGEPLIGRLLLVDALDMRFRELKLRKNPDCPACGTHPTVTKLIDYQQFCGVPGKEAHVPEQQTSQAIPQLTPEQLKSRLDAGDKPFILDVREPHEYQISNLGGHLIPLNDLPQRVGELDRDQDIVVHCKSGGRSQKAAEFLQQAGFRKVANLAGGINGWADKVDPTLPKY